MQKGLNLATHGGFAIVGVEARQIDKQRCPPPPFPLKRELEAKPQGQTQYSVSYKTSLVF